MTKKHIETRAYPLVLPKEKMEALKTKAWRKRTTLKALLEEIIDNYLKIKA